MAILQKKEEMDGYNIDDEIIKYIATNIKSNIRELEGALNRLNALAKLEKKEITIEFAEEALKDIISPDAKKEITPELIIDVVAEHFHISSADIKGSKRNSEIVVPRQIVMYLCRGIMSAKDLLIPVEQIEIPRQKQIHAGHMGCGTVPKIIWYRIGYTSIFLLGIRDIPKPFLIK